MFLSIFKNHQDKTIEKDPSRFAILSQGRTASYWLAAALDAHPQITCGHSKQNPPVPDYLGEGRGRTLDDVIGDTVVLPSSPAEYYNLLETCGSGPLYGTVHAFGVGERVNVENDGIHAALLTRHPISRCASYADRRQIEIENSDAVMERTHLSLEGNIGRFPGAAAALDGVSEQDWIPFLSACFDVAYEATQLPHFSSVIQSERLTAEPDYLEWFLYDFIGVTASQDYLDEVYSRGRLNTLAGLRSTAFSTFVNWTDWQKETFRIFCQSYKISNFSTLGYDVEGIIKAARDEAGWSDPDRVAKAALDNAPYVIRNLGQINPKYVRAGTLIDVFVNCNETDLFLRFGEMNNSTELLHRSLPPGLKTVKLSFEAPRKPGIYPFSIEAADGSGCLKQGLCREIAGDLSLEVREAEINLKDHGLLRFSVRTI